MTRQQRREEPSVTDLLRQEIQDSGLTHYAVAKRAGIKPDMIRRFMIGERDLRAETFAKVCKALGLTLVKASDEKSNETKGA